MRAAGGRSAGTGRGSALLQVSPSWAPPLAFGHSANCGLDNSLDAGVGLESRNHPVGPFETIGDPTTFRDVAGVPVASKHQRVRAGASEDDGALIVESEPGQAFGDRKKAPPEQGQLKATLGERRYVALPSWRSEALRFIVFLAQSTETFDFFWIFSRAVSSPKCNSAA